MSDLLRQPGPSHPLPGLPAPHGDSDFEAVFSPAACLACIYDQTVFSEGPTWWPARDMLVWSDVEGRRVLAWQRDGSVRVLIDATPFINGNAVDACGSLVHCEHGTRRLSRTRPDGHYQAVVETFEGRRFNSPNDVACAPDGALWFSDPTFGLNLPRQGTLAEPELDHRSVYRFDTASGTLSRMADFEQPNGLAFSPSGDILYVSESSVALDGRRHEIIAFDVGPDQELSNRRLFAVIERGFPDGLRVDARGWVWAATGGGVQAFSPDQSWLGLIPTPRAASNLCFGPDERELFITAGEGLYSIDLADRGS